MVIGIVGANDKEMNLLKTKIDFDEKVEISNHDFYRGKLNNKEIVVTISGIGKVNTAVTTQILVDHFNADKVIFIGVAGAIDPDLEIGDVVVSEDCMQHDVDMTAFDLPRGQFLFSDSRIYKADDELVEMVVQAAKDSDFNVSKGRVLSGDQFITDENKAKSLRHELKGDCIEMEGAALAHVCEINDVPFVIIRHICDKTDHSANVDADAFCETAARNSYKIITRMFQS